MGVAFRNIKGPVCPAVVFYASYVKEVQIVSYRKGVDVLLSQSETNSNRPVSPIPNPVPDPVQSCNPNSNSPPTRRPTTRSTSNPDTTSVYTHKFYVNPVQSLPISTCRTTFDVDSKRGPVTVTEDKLTLIRTSEMKGNAYCLLNEVCTRGVYRWSFRVDTDRGASTCIGITTEPVDMCNPLFIFHSKSMLLCRSFQGSLYFQGRELEKNFNEFWFDGSEVELTLDLDNFVLQYSIDGVDQGIAFCSCRGRYRPVVAFYAEMDKKITLLKFEQITVNQRPRQVSLSEGINDLSVAMDSPMKEKEPPLKPSEQSNLCIICSVKDNNVQILPCKHAVYCPVHAETEETCVVCGVTITGVWNVF